MIRADSVQNEFRVVGGEALQALQVQRRVPVRHERGSGRVAADHVPPLEYTGGKLHGKARDRSRPVRGELIEVKMEKYELLSPLTMPDLLAKRERCITLYFVSICINFFQNQRRYFFLQLDCVFFLCY